MPDFYQSSESNEWYTPGKYIEPAYTLMGGIDLDPASSSIANRTVKADRIYTEAEDGLSKVWRGRVWLNPPYGRQGRPAKSGEYFQKERRFYREGEINENAGPLNAELFTQKVIEEWRQRNVEQAVMLTSSATDTNWFKSFWEFPVCLTNHRIPFLRVDGSKATGNTKGSVFVYLPPRSHEIEKSLEFERLYSQFGKVIIPDGYRHGV